MVLRFNPSGSSLILLDKASRVVEKAVGGGQVKKEFWGEGNLGPVGLGSKHLIVDETDLKRVCASLNRKLPKNDFETVLGSSREFRGSLEGMRKEQLSRMRGTTKSFGIPEAGVPRVFLCCFQLELTLPTRKLT